MVDLRAQRALHGADEVEDMREALERDIEASGDTRIRLAGLLNQEATRELIRRSKLLALPCVKI